MKIRITKKMRWKAGALLGLPVLLSLASLDLEALAFRFTAPSDALVTASVHYLTKRFRLSEEEKNFVYLASPRLEKRNL